MYLNLKNILKIVLSMTSMVTMFGERQVKC
jgi:hypothetical protein